MDNATMHTGEKWNQYVTTVLKAGRVPHTCSDPSAGIGIEP